MAILTLVFLALLLVMCSMKCSGSLTITPTLSIVDSFRRAIKNANKESVVVCSTFCFDSVAAQDLHKKMFNECDRVIKLTGGGMALFTSSVEPETLAHIQGSDVGIGYMHVATLTGDTSKFIASVSSILEHSIGLRNKVHIVLVVHGDFAREKILTSGHPLSIESLKRKAVALIREAFELTPKYSNTYQVTFEGLVSVDVAFIDGTDLSIETAKSTITTVASSLAFQALSAEKLSVIQSGDVHKKKATSTAEQIIHGQISNELTDDLATFFSNLSGQLDNLYEASEKNVPISAGEVRAAIDSTLVPLLKRTADIISKYSSVTDPASMSSYHLLDGLVRILRNAFTRLATSQGRRARELLSEAISSAPANSELKLHLNEITQVEARALARQLSSLLKDLKSNFVEVASNILQSPAAATSWAQVFEGSLNANYEVSLFKKDARKLCSDHIDKCFLDGLYNPFVRTHSFPPLKFNFNYLVDPRSVIFGLEYNKLYEEHYNGPADRRADPLLIPGAAMIPFDPNKHPEAREKKSWWQIIKDFYADVDNDEEE